MSKKMLKRSLALGALMAFVITGQAWAENISGKYVKNSNGVATAISNIDTTLSAKENDRLDGLRVQDGILNVTGDVKLSLTGEGENSYILGINSTATGDWKTNNNNRPSSITIGGKTDIDIVSNYQRIIGIQNNYNVNIASEIASKIDFEDAVDIDISNTSNYIGQFMEGLYAHYSETNFEKDASIYVENNRIGYSNNIGFSEDRIIALNGDAEKTVVNFKGNTTLKYVNNANFEGAVNGITASGYGYVNFIGNEATIDINAGNVNGGADGLSVQYSGKISSALNNELKILVNGKSINAIRGVAASEYSGTTGGIDLKGSTVVEATNNGTGNAYGVYGEAGADIDLADTTITATSKDGRAYGVWVDESTIDIADTTITATSENSRAVGIAAANSGNEVYVDGDITINATAGERADGMNLDNATVNVTGKLTIDATGKTDDYKIGSQGVRLAESTAQFADVDISVKSTTDGTVYGIRMLGDNNTTSTQLDISGNADVYAETNGVAYGIIVSTGANVDLKDDISDVGNNLNVTVKGKEEASAIRAQYGSSINVSANTDVEIIATSENGNAYGVVNSYLTYDDANYAKANANISILGNVNIEANGETGSYAVYNSTDYNKEEAENVGNTIIGGEGKVVTITGDMYANSGSITTTFGAEGSQFDGKVETVDSGTTTLNFAKGAIWNLKGASTLTNATFDAGSVLVIEGKTFDAKEGSTDYALNGVGSDSKLTVKDGAKLTVTGIKETTYNIAKGFKTLEGTKVDETTTKYWDVNDVNTLMQGVLWNNGENGLQLEVYAKPADTLSEEMNVSESTAQSLASVTEAARVAEKEGAKPDVNGTGDAKAVALVNAIANAPSEVAGQVFEAVSKMAEAGGNSATAASIVKNVTGVTNDRLSFNCGHSAPQKGGHGVGLFEEGSGADVWVEYVHGKDEVEDMPSTAGATSYEGKYNGIVMGVDFKKVNKFQSGIAFNNGEGDTNSVGSAARTHSDYDFWGIGYYSNIHNDDSNVIFDIGYAKTDSDVENTNELGVNFKASPETTTWTAGVKLEKLYQNENVQIVPYSGLRFMSIDPDDYSTECASASYKMERQNVWLLPLGVSIKQEVTNDNGWTVSPRVDLSYIWAFGDTDSEMEFSTLGTKNNIGYVVMDDGSFLGLVGIEAHKGQWGYGVSYSYQKGDHSESKKWYVDVNYSF